MSPASSERHPDPVALDRDELIRALQARERFLDAILGSLEIFLTVDEDWRITFVNGAAAAASGTDPEDLLGRDLRELASAVLFGETLEKLQLAMDERVGGDYEVDGPGDTAYLGRVYPLADGGLAVYVRDMTEAKRRERERDELFAALELSEQRYRHIVETTGDGIMIGDPEGVITFVNQRMADMLGYGVDELVGTHGFELIFPDWQPTVLDNRAALDEGEVVRGEFKLRRKDGTAIWTMFSSTPMADPAGDHVGNLTMHSDITELKAAEEALRRSDERFRMVLSAASVTVAAQDEDLRYVWAFNQRTAPADGVVGKADADLFTAEEAERLTAIKRRVLAEGKELREQLWLDRPRGRIFLDCTFSPLRDESGEMAGVGVTTVDLTQMRLAEEARRQSEETLRSFYDSAPFLMGVARLEGERTVVVTGNRAMGAFLGMDVADISERSGVELGNTPEFERALVAAYRESQTAGRPAYVEQRLTQGDKTVVMSFTVAHFGQRSDGEPLFSFVAEDVTRRRRAEHALRESELAAAAQVEKTRLARDLHDSVTQALFAASLKAEALTNTGDTSPEIDELAEEVRRLTGGALAQMRAMLLELRGEALETVPIRQLLRNVVEATGSRTRTRVKLSIEGDEDIPADLHVALYRITQEALNNVVRHARAKNSWVDLRLEPSAVRLTVRDDGRGFDPAPFGPTHLGLRSMRERATEVGAGFRLVTAPGGGTEIIVERRRTG